MGAIRRLTGYAVLMLLGTVLTCCGMGWRGVSIEEAFSGEKERELAEAARKGRERKVKELLKEGSG